MTSLDPNIILQGRPAEISDPLENYSRLAQLQGLLRQNADAEEARQRRRGLDAAVAGATGADGTVDPKGVVSRLAALGYGADAMQYQDQAEQRDREREASQVQRQTGRLNLSTAQHQQALANIDLGVRLFGDVKDQAGYDWAMQTAQANGVEVSHFGLGPTYDPAVVQRALGMAQGSKERLQQSLAEQKIAASAANTAADNQTRVQIAADNRTSREGIAGANRAAANGRARLPRPGQGGRTPAGYRTSPNGDLTYIPGGPGDPAVLEAQARARRVPVGGGGARPAGAVAPGSGLPPGWGVQRVQE